MNDKRRNQTVTKIYAWDLGGNLVNLWIVFKPGKLVHVHIHKVLWNTLEYSQKEEGYLHLTVEEQVALNSVVDILAKGNCLCQQLRKSIVHLGKFPGSRIP